ncbi:hypothetical protein B0T26DRAFT_753088 [Lasiosphaeria miniovina]|uniref:Uncharacterized protein n=1 Tax=Lasiosphaeria miniovina TaxID=1954250 RepID=A0AA40DRI5_9PEZI|nr:uncharacterized protein B0T26DRAFT_753088 [Lasiosphaeria miniovina]KAK0712910.1 hypothetical protein B0T26DRAFT_753088 [Lasiosphaeria miniovina]
MANAMDDDDRLAQHSRLWGGDAVDFDTEADSSRMLPPGVIKDGGGAQLTCQLVFLDMLRSVSDAWDSFLQRIARRVVDESLRLFEEDLETTTQWSLAVRNLDACPAFLLSSVEAALKDLSVSQQRSKESQQRVSHWHRFSVASTSLAAEMRSQADDLVQRSNREMAFFVANINEKQASGGGRLTMIAAVFLPLSLSSSLLAMTTPAADAGALRYDWAGLCVVMGVLVLAIYSSWKVLQKAKRWRPKRVQNYLCLFSGAVKALTAPPAGRLDVLKYGIAAIAAGLPAWIIVKNPVWVYKAIKGLLTCIFVIATMFWAMKRKGKRTNDASSV